MQHMESSYSGGSSLSSSNSSSTSSSSNSVNNDASDDSYTLAIVAECLYLINLLFFPGLAFIVLTMLYLTNRQHPSMVVRCHLRQTVVASIWAGVMIVIVSLIMLFIGGPDEPGTWIVGVLYFLSIHGALVLMGGIGLTRAINNKHFHYPFIGPKCTGSE